ncbi:hypothetical protein WKH50_19295 [Pantoea agglomerans]|uniref:hypothetical protein n=1 Tax=Enterobacter agglomerans TaxID=549 RepID=UPI0007E56BCE|nr:hypothetical protein [Pantoea agglomerans]WHU86728.1 hypothetical protein A7P62_12580 [Pantoea agglomerans pv. gypsophilae]
MIGLIMNLVSKLGDLLLNKIPSKSKDEVQADNTETANETNREEIKAGMGWRNALGFVITSIIFYNWIIVPVLDAFGIVVIQVPLGQLLQVLLIMVGGS